MKRENRIRNIYLSGISINMVFKVKRMIEVIREMSVEGRRGLKVEFWVTFMC